MSAPSASAGAPSGGEAEVTVKSLRARQKDLHHLISDTWEMNMRLMDQKDERSQGMCL